MEARIRRVERGLQAESWLWSRAGDRSTITERMQVYGTPGVSIAVVNRGELEWSRGYGVTEAGGTVPVTPRTIFQACSISKHVAMLAAVRLAQDRVIDLDEDVNRYLRSWKLPANGPWQPRITVRQLLGHTAGLSSNWFRGFRRGDPLPSLGDVLEGRPPANTPPVRVVMLPGAVHAYSGSNYAVLQQLLEDVSGASFADLMHDSVLDPLGMTDSSYDQRYPEISHVPVAAGHHSGGGPIEGGWRVVPEMAGAGLWATPCDLARVILEIQHACQGRSSVFLRQEMAEQVLAPQAGSAFGLGSRLTGEGPLRRFGHAGLNIGYACLSDAYVEQGLGAVVMTSCDDGSIVGEVFGAIAREYEWPGYGPGREPAGTGAELPCSYAGQYELRPGFVLSVELVDSGLALRVPGQEPVPFRLSSRGSFFSESLNAEITFHGEERTPTELRLVHEGRELRAPRLHPR